MGFFAALDLVKRKTGRSSSNFLLSSRANSFEASSKILSLLDLAGGGSLVLSLGGGVGVEGEGEEREPDRLRACGLMLLALDEDVGVW